MSVALIIDKIDMAIGDKTNVEAMTDNIKIEVTEIETEIIFIILIFRINLQIF